MTINSNATNFSSLRLGNLPMQNGVGVPQAPIQVFVENPVNDATSNYVALAGQAYGSVKSTAQLNPANMSYHIEYNKPILQLDCDRKLKFVIGSKLDRNNNGAFLIRGTDSRGAYIEDLVEFNTSTTCFTDTRAAPLTVAQQPYFYDLSSRIGGALGATVVSATGVILGSVLTIRTDTALANNETLDITLGLKNSYGDITYVTRTILNSTQTIATLLKYSDIVSVKTTFKIADVVSPHPVAKKISLLWTDNNTADIDPNSLIAYSNKCFYSVYSIDANPYNVVLTNTAPLTYSIGVANKIQLPVFIPNKIFLLSFMTNAGQVPIALSVQTGTGNFTLGYNFYKLGAPNLRTPDARGTVGFAETSPVAPFSVGIYSYGLDNEISNLLQEKNTSWELKNTNNYGTSSYLSPYYKMKNIITNALDANYYPYYLADKVTVNPNHSLYAPDMLTQLSDYDVVGVNYPNDTVYKNGFTNFYSFFGLPQR